MDATGAQCGEWQMDYSTQGFILVAWLAEEGQGVKWGSFALIQKKKVGRKRSQNTEEGRRAQGPLESNRGLVQWCHLGVQERRRRAAAQVRDLKSTWATL